MVSWSACFFAAVWAGAAHAVALDREEQAHSSIIRRHDESHSEAELLPSGELLRKANNKGDRVDLQSKNTRRTHELRECNRHYVANSVEGNDCEASYGGELIKLTDKELCEHAAGVLGDGHVTELNDEFAPNSTLPYPKDCFVASEDHEMCGPGGLDCHHMSVQKGHIYFNPAQMIPDEYKYGHKICYMAKYPTASIRNSDGSWTCPASHIFTPMARAGSTPGDDEWLECKAAKDCILGVLGCPTNEIHLNSTVVGRPTGCFINGDLHDPSKESGCVKFSTCEGSECSWANDYDEPLCKIIPGAT